VPLEYFLLRTRVFRDLAHNLAIWRHDRRGRHAAAVLGRIGFVDWVEAKVIDPEHPRVRALCEHFADPAVYEKALFTRRQVQLVGCLGGLGKPWKPSLPTS
jgi:hypothetical protein